MTPQELDAIRARHRAHAMSDVEAICLDCSHERPWVWPCDAARLLAEVDDCLAEHPPEQPYLDWCAAGRPDVSRLRGLLKEAREALADDDLRADGPRRALLSRLDAELSPATVTR